MSEERTEAAIRKAINQALLCIARSRVLPKDNLLVNSAAVLKIIQESGLEDTPEQRHVCVERLLKEIVNDYGTQPSNERVDVHLRTFDVALQLLQGKKGKKGMPSRTYDRYRHRAVVMLSRRFLEKEREVSRSDSNSQEKQKLDEVLKKADEAEEILRNTSGRLDLVTLLEFISLATQIHKFDYPDLARPRLHFALNQLDLAPETPVVLRSRNNVLSSLGHVFINLGQTAEAKICFRRLIQGAEIISDKASLVWAKQSLGTAYRLNNEFADAINFYRLALERVYDTPYPIHSRAWILRDLAATMVEAGNLAEAEALAKESIRLRDKLSDISGGMMSRQVLARVYTQRGRFDSAEALLEEAWKMAPKDEFVLFRVIVLKTFGELYRSWHQRDAWISYLSEARHLALQHGLWHQLDQISRLETRL